MKFGGIDAHKSFSQVCILDKDAGVLDESRIPSTREALWGMLDALRDTSRVALEASSHWGWIVDELQRMGVDVVLSHPTKTKAIASAKIKTDKIDARMLAYLLSADLLPEAHVPDIEVRQLRSYLRHRWSLVAMRTMAKNRIHNILTSYGLSSPYRVLFCNKGRAWLCEQELGDLSREQVSNYLKMIDLLSSLVVGIDEQIKPMAQQDRQAALLMSIPGIGYYSALLISAEIDGIERFGSAKQLVSYAGLCPSTHASGGRERHGHITRTGSRFLRWILVEAAQRAVFPSSPLNRIYWSIAKRKGSGTAKVAVARKLLESIYQMLKTGQEFNLEHWVSAAG